MLLSQNLKTLDDLARVSSSFAFGTDLEFLERPEWQMVQDAYPLRFKEARSFNPTFMYPALASGEVDVISAFSSDGRIAANNFVVLEDEKGAVPSYETLLLIAPGRKDDANFVACHSAALIGAITCGKYARGQLYGRPRRGQEDTPVRPQAGWTNR